MHRLHPTVAPTAEWGQRNSSVANAYRTTSHLCLRHEIRIVPTPREIHQTPLANDAAAKSKATKFSETSDIKDLYHHQHQQYQHTSVNFAALGTRSSLVGMTYRSSPHGFSPLLTLAVFFDFIDFNQELSDPTDFTDADINEPPDATDMALSAEEIW
mmetsp:Transcript_24929/g.58064  ORF Transcript_24929/g.58064 Transcript_24929/m.58064 type:complete len:157 (-) Transcript_24929:1427-1897(-)